MNSTERFFFGLLVVLVGFWSMIAFLALQSWTHSGIDFGPMIMLSCITLAIGILFSISAAKRGVEEDQW